MKDIAKKITISRIVLSIALLFTTVFTTPFYIIYIYCGLSDILDDYFAKKRKEEMGEGTKLDTVADIVFIVCGMIKIVPDLLLPKLLFFWFGFIVIVKIYNILYSLIHFKTIKLPYSLISKIAGALLFLTPLIVSKSDSDIIYVLCCLVATAAVINETKLVKKEEEDKKAANTMTVQTYDFNQKSK